MIFIALVTSTSNLKKIKCKHFQEANSFLYSTSSFNVQVYFFHLNILNICFLNLGYMSAKIIRHYVTFNTKNIQQFTNVTHPCFNNTVYVSYCTRGKKILIDLFKHFTNRWEQVMGMYIVRTVYNTLYSAVLYVCIITLPIVKRDFAN